MKINFGDHVSFNRKGEGGTSVHVQMELADGGWLGDYSFDTHGMAVAEIAAKVTQLHAHHIAKCVRLDALAAEVFSQRFTVGSATFRIVDCTMREVGGEVELYVDVRDAARLDVPVEGFPTAQRFATVAEVMDNASIVKQAVDRITSINAAKQAHGQVIAAAKHLIGG